jgi:hypothetical protein
VVEMLERFQRVLSLQEVFRTVFEPGHHMACPYFHEGDDPESQDPIDPNYICNPVLPPDLDIESFQDLSQEELAIPLSEHPKNHSGGSRKELSHEHVACASASARSEVKVAHCFNYAYASGFDPGE